MNQEPIVLSLFDYSGVMVEPWVEAGVEAWIVDIQHEPGVETGEDGIVRVGADILRWLPPRRPYLMAFAFPPCTNLAVSGARWFKSKGLGALSDAINLVERARDILAWTQAPWMLENPVSTLSTYWRKPDYTFDPCDFGGYLDPEGDQYTKKTCLWTGGSFVMPEEKAVEPVEGSKMHLLPPSEDRAKLRSMTPKGFARAVFEANQHQVREYRRAA